MQHVVISTEMLLQLFSLLFAEEAAAIDGA
jgi:hypothetical protein